MAPDSDTDSSFVSGRRGEDDHGSDRNVETRFGALLADKEYVSDRLLRTLVSAGVVDVDSALRILLVMHARNGRENWRSAPGLASRLGIRNVRAVEKALARLVDDGFCWREGRPGQRRRHWRLGKKPAGAYIRKKLDAQNGDSQIPQTGHPGCPQRAIVNPPNGDSQIPESGNPHSTVSRSQKREYSGGGGEAETRTTTTTESRSKSAGDHSGEYASLGLDDPIEESSLAARGDCVEAKMPVEVSAEMSAEISVEVFAENSAKASSGVSPEVAGESIRRGIRRIDPDAGFHQGSFDERRRALAAGICERNGISPSALEDIAAVYAERRARSGGPPGQWKLDWFLDEFPRLVAERLAPPAVPREQSSQATAPTSEYSPDGPVNAEAGARFMRHFAVASTTFYGFACARGERDPRELTAAEEALSILERNRCRNRMTIDAWIKWYFMTINAEEAAKYGVRVRQMVPTWPEFARVRPRPENALVPTRRLDPDSIWKNLASQLDVASPKADESILMLAMDYGVFVVANYLGATVGRDRALELLIGAFARVRKSDSEWKRWVLKIHASTRRYERSAGGYPAGCFLADWRGEFAELWRAAGCDDAMPCPESSPESRVFAAAFLQRLGYGTAAAA